MTASISRKRLQCWQIADDPQLWKLILSPEFGDRIDLPRLTRDLIEQMKRDLGTDLEWAAVEHHNTEHPTRSCGDSWRER
jgi:type IV secretory pathway VirD2 relaxase